MKTAVRITGIHWCGVCPIGWNWFQVQFQMAILQQKHSAYCVTDVYGDDLPVGVIDGANAGLVVRNGHLRSWVAEFLFGGSTCRMAAMARRLPETVSEIELCAVVCSETVTPTTIASMIKPACGEWRVSWCGRRLRSQP